MCYNISYECDNMQDAQKHLNDIYIELDNSTKIDFAKKVLFPKGHKYEGLICIVHYAYGIHHGRYILEEE